MNGHENEFKSLLNIDTHCVVNSTELILNLEDRFYIQKLGYTFYITVDKNNFYSCSVDLIRNIIRLSYCNTLDNDDEVNLTIYRSIPFNVDSESYFQYCLGIKGYVPQYDTVLKIQGYVKNCLKLLNNTCNVYDIDVVREIYEIKHYPVTGIF